MAPKFKARVLSTTKIIKNISIVSILLLSFFLVLFSKSDYILINSIKNFTSSFINPLTKVVSSPVRLISNINNEYIQFKNLKFENKILHEEIIRLKKWQTLAIQNTRENKVLKRLLNATDNNLKLIKTASLINRNQTFYSNMININAGYEDKIEKNMSAINDRGLVGKVNETTSSNSRVLLVNDPNFTLSIKTVSDEIFSIVTGVGDKKQLVSKFIKNNNMPKVGDIVVTSGTAEVFPVDLLVGKISRVENNRFYVLPFVDFNNIDYLQIVTSK